MIQAIAANCQRTKKPIENFILAPHSDLPLSLFQPASQLALFPALSLSLTLNYRTLICFTK